MKFFKRTKTDNAVSDHLLTIQSSFFLTYLFLPSLMNLMKNDIVKIIKPETMVSGSFLKIYNVIVNTESKISNIQTYRNWFVPWNETLHTATNGISIFVDLEENRTINK